MRGRLANAHEDDVAHALAGEPLGFEKLAHDFAGREIAREAVEPARAEFASIRAPDLRADAECAPVARLPVKRGRRGNQHALDERAVGQAEEILPRRVLAAEHAE